MLCFSFCLHNSGIICHFPKILLISCIFVILSPGTTNTTFCLSFLLISIWCTSIISFYNNGTFYNEKDSPTTQLSCYWIFIFAIAQDSFEKVSHSNDLKSYTSLKIIKCLSHGVGRVIKLHCTQRHKTTQLAASHHAGSCTPFRHPSYGISLPFELVITPANPFLWTQSLFHSPFTLTQSLLWQWSYCQFTLDCSVQRSRCSMTHATLTDTSYG